jgi:RHS repeat-associated protein
MNYDLDGNLVRDGRWMYSWDAENRLVRVMSWGNLDRRRVDWTYDAMGRRVRQVRYVWTNSTWQVVEDLKLVSDPVWFGRHIAELNGTNGALVRSYVWGLDVSETLDGAGGVGGLLWVRLNTSPASGAHFVTYEGNGNVWTLVSASTGTETARYEYGPFRQPLRLTGAAAGWNPFRFSTKRTEDGTGLMLYEYRAYSPALGRWLCRDPLEEQSGSYSLRAGPASLVGAQPYTVLHNGPVFRFDLLGLAHPIDVPWWPPKCDPPPQPPSPQPPQADELEGFALCRRAIDGSDKKFLERLCTRVINPRGGLHRNVQYYKSAQEPRTGPPYLWGWGFSGGEVMTPEKHWNRSVCGPCNNNGTALKHGSGAGNEARVHLMKRSWTALRMEILIGGTPFQHTCVVLGRSRRCGIVVSHVSDIQTSCILCCVLFLLLC